MTGSTPANRKDIFAGRLKSELGIKGCYPVDITFRHMRKIRYFPHHVFGKIGVFFLNYLEDWDNVFSSWFKF